MSEQVPRFNRRQFVAGGAAFGLTAANAAANGAPLAAAARASTAPTDPLALRWLDGSAPALHAGLTWGLPWARGQVQRGQALVLRDAQGQAHPLQSWPLAYWPDGSLKWTAQAIAPGVSVGEGWQVQPLPAGQPAPSTPGVVVTVADSADAFTVDTGTVIVVVPRRGPLLMRSVTRSGVEVLRSVKLVAQSDSPPQGANTATAHFESQLEQVTVEQPGPQRAVLRLQGKHRNTTPGAARAWLPFDLRLYFYAGGDALRVMHSWVFDGEPQRDFIRGLGLQFEVPLRDAPHDRHVRFAGEGNGLWAEAVRGLTGLRRDPGAAVRAAQLAGQPTPPVDGWHPSVRKFLERIPAWGDVTLTQLSPDSFQIKKRTQAGQTWVHSAWGGRAAGLGYVGDTRGGVAFGLRDFWQRHPAQLDIRNAHTATAQVTCWFWSPEAPAMDLRPYHDGLGQDSFDKQLEGLEVTYEDWEPGFDTSVGAGRSHEITLFAVAGTPARERLVQLASLVQTPPLLVAAPQRYLSTRVFGTLWTLPDRSTPQKAALEERLDFLVNFYQREAEQRRWYGFWDFGDVRHTFDADRHEWRYDVGGYAWDNSELSPDLWLWGMFFRSGRADVFRFAEAMVRHTTEVDTYHLGRFKGLGTRHGVLHWSDSAKQLRISTAAYRRQYHYLTADERVGDVLHMLRDADRQLIALNPTRKVKDAPKLPPGQAVMGVGTDWGSMLANWLTEWERTGDVRWRDKIRRGMASVAGMKHGFFSAAGAGYDPETGELRSLIGERVAASHLSAVFGLVEMVAELIELIEVPGFEQAWLQYCRLYNAPVDEQRREFGMPHGGANALMVGHSRLTAYAAMRLNDPALARRAWAEFNGDRRRTQPPLGTRRVEGPAVLRPVDVAPWVNTNEAAQWSLAAMQNLAWVGAQLPME
jgi:YetA-like protein